jgi:hypothetical protein
MDMHGKSMRKIASLLFVMAALASFRAEAWGDLGHRVTALIAYRHLTAPVRVALDLMLASDPDVLTRPDFASRATWADKYRSEHRDTAAWHYVNIEIDYPDLADACFGYPALAAAQWASQGPAQDCVVNKIEQFAAELHSPATPPAERLAALKFLIHFVGDLHQPLHAGDHHDRGGNCVRLAGAPRLRENNLHAYWDVGVVAALGNSAEQIADKLDAGIKLDQLKAWTDGNPRSWAMESFEIARRDAYALPSLADCQSSPIDLSPAYEAQAQKDAATQLLKAAIRIAGLLNGALGT